MTFSKEEAVRFGWDRMKANLPLFLIMGLIGLVLAAFQNGINAAAAQLDPAVRGFAALANLAVQLVNLGLQIAMVRIALKLQDGQPVGTPDLTAGLGDFISYLLASLLYGLIVAGGVLLLIVPGIMWATRFAFFGFAIVDEHLDPITALKRSSQLTEGLRMEVFVFGVLLALINLLGAMALGVGVVATIPLTVIAMARVYRTLATRAGPVPSGLRTTAAAH